MTEPIPWDAISAIGELLGSLAVVITLIYLIRQLRSSETAAINSSQSAIQMTRIAVNSQRYDHLDLILRADKGDELTPLEQEQLRMLCTSEMQTMFFTFMNFRRLGSDGEIQAFNFARFLHTHPSMIAVWKREIELWPSQNQPASEWREKVNRNLTEIQAERVDT